MYWSLDKNLVLTHRAHSEKLQTKTFMMLQMNYERKFCFSFGSVAYKSNAEKLYAFIILGLEMKM